MQVKMSSDHQDSDTRGFQPPSTVEELHRQPPFSTNGNNHPHSTTLRLPHTSSLMAPVVITNDPESPIADVLGGGIFTIPTTSSQDAVAETTTSTTVISTHHPLRVSDTNSSSNQDSSTTTITTPPKVPEPPRRNILLRRSHFDPITSDYQDPEKNKSPPARVSSPPSSRTSPPGSSTRKQIPQSKLRKMSDKVREIKQRFWNVIRQSEEHVEDDNPHQAMVDHEEEEYLLLERLDDGGCLLRWSCGNGKGMCMDVVFFLCVFLTFSVVFIIGLTICFMLFSIVFRYVFHTLR
ncbi:unnamed protein product [Lactuca saligna]|uniref:Uncharacterized protein n=1 Tax=Lactuca saligna TaxID=75948 RepID=A0AA35YME8_LACSI|nr:unnamed protein product [Lactuca saligna]